MYINFRKRNNKNNTTYNSESKINNTTSSSINFKTNNNSRNNKLISLQKKQKTSKIYLHTFNNIRTNKKLNEEHKFLFYNDSKDNKHVNNINTMKGIAYSNIKNKLYNKENLFLKKNIKNENEKSMDLIPKIKNDILPHSLENNKSNFIFKNYINNNNNLRSSTEKNIFNKRYSTILMPKSKNNIRKSFSNINANNSNNNTFNPRNSIINNPDLKDKITQLLKELSNNNKVDLKYYEKGDDYLENKKKRKIIKNKTNYKTIEFLARKNRNKFLNLLNKDGSLNSFLKTMKFKTTNNIFKSFSHKENIMKRPKNTIEMNKLLINSFGLNKGGPNDVNNKLYTLNETFFNIMNEMKKARAEMELENLNKYDKDTPINIELMKKKEKKWEKKFLLSMYRNKLSEKEFINFKKLNKIQQRKDILKESQLLADNLMKIDAEEYEEPDDLYEYKSTKSFVSNRNVYRIRRVKRIMKNIEDKEQLGAYDVNVEKLKQNQKESETEGMLAIKRSGKPRFVKTQFKSSTIKKYKGVSGD